MLNRDIMVHKCIINPEIRGYGCDSVGRVVASDTIDLRFEPSDRQKFILNIASEIGPFKNIFKKTLGMAHLKTLKTLK